MAELVLKTAFDELPSEIHDWLASDAVANLISGWDRTFGLTGEQGYAIPCVITWITLGDIKAENCIPSLIDDFGIGYKIAHSLAQEIKDKVFAKISLAMRTKLGIDVEKITQPPAPAPIVAPAPVAPPSTPTAQITKIKGPLMADIRKAPAQTGTKAQTTVMEKPFPDQSAGAPIQGKTPEPPKPKSLAGEAATLEIKKPFGFIEVEPKPPEPQNVVPYKDEHPVVE